MRGRLHHPPDQGTFRDASKRYWEAIEGSETDLNRRQRGGGPGGAAYLEEKRGKAYPAIPRLWRSSWEQFIAFLDYGGPLLIRSCRDEHGVSQAAFRGGDPGTRLFTGGTAEPGVRPPCDQPCRGVQRLLKRDARVTSAR